MKKTTRRLLGKALFPAFAAAAAGLAAAYLFLAYPAFNAKLDDLVSDAWARLGAAPPENPRAAVVDIDQASIKKLGQLPWPRTILSELVSVLLAQGAAAIALDVWLTEPDRSSPVAVDSRLEREFGLNLDFSKLPIEVLDNDRYFRNSIAGKPVVLGAHAVFGPGAEASSGAAPLSVIREAPSGKDRPGEGVAAMNGLVPPVPVLADAAQVGLLNFNVDGDGIVRSIPLLARSGGDFYPALSLRALMAARGEKALKLEGSPGEPLLLRLGDLEIPAAQDGSFRPVYYGKTGALPYYSAAAVLDGEIPAKDIAGKIIFIGPSAPSLRNVHSTPLDPAVPGPEIHATVAQNILDGLHATPPAHARPIQLCVIFAAACAGALIFRFCALPVYAAAYLTLSGAAVLASWLCFRGGTLFSPLGAISALTLSGLVILPVRYWREQAEKRKLRRAFSQYVAPEVAARIVADGGELLKGEQKEVTIMFTDVRGFTAIAEKLSPPQLVGLLNRYFTPMTACVTARKGTLDKFIGDALMAFWNAPLDVEGHAREATLAALEMQAALERLRPSLKGEFGVDMRMGIGLNTGLAHVGNMGSTDLLDYTCIGENVNLASRLEGMCKRYGVSIAASEAVREACGGAVPFLPLDRIRVKGSARPQKIYAPLQEREMPNPAAEKLWREALDAYFAGRFSEAAKIFAELAKNPFLRQACALFGERCRAMAARPAEAWDGVWTYLEK